MTNLQRAGRRRSSHPHAALVRGLAQALFLLAAGTLAGAEITSPQALRVFPDTVRQGGIVRVVLRLREGYTVGRASLYFAGVETPCFERDGTIVGLFAVSVKAPPRTASGVLHLRYADGTEERYPFSIRVRAAAFPTQHLRMPPSKTGLMSERILEKERQILYVAMVRTASEPLWTGAFANPLPGRITSPFGRKRYVNGRLWGHHSGLDVSSPSGRPVRAANAGRVLVAQKLWMRGNTILLDHGMGVFTLYCHLSRIEVQPGQEIRKGDVIGHVGATGFVTGPHLHWELRVHRIPANPAGPLREGIRLDGPWSDTAPD